MFYPPFFSLGHSRMVSPLVSPPLCALFSFETFFLVVIPNCRETHILLWSSGRRRRDSGHLSLPLPRNYTPVFCFPYPASSRSLFGLYHIETLPCHPRTPGLFPLFFIFDGSAFGCFLEHRRELSFGLTQFFELQFLHGFRKLFANANLFFFSNP